jgi:uncharacterized protein YbaP (TraB family)
MIETVHCSEDVTSMRIGTLEGHCSVCLRFVPVVLTAALLWLVSAAVHTTERSQGLLWEIGKPGISPSYLFGTIHSEDPEVLDLAQPVRKAWSGSRRVVLEVVLDSEAMLQTGSAMLMTDGQLLSQILGEELFRQTLLTMQRRGVPEVVLERMKPWAVATTLSMPAAGTGMVLDRVLYEQALQDGKPVAGLETVQEQLDIFEGMSMDDQVALLRDAVAQFSGIAALHQQLLDAYKQQDLAAMLAINEAALEAGDRRFADEFQRRLVTDRNRHMAERLRPYLSEGRAFVAVGALHLPGDEGLLNLLERQGYTVSAVY